MLLIVINIRIVYNIYFEVLLCSIFFFFFIARIFFLLIGIVNSCAFKQTFYLFDNDLVPHRFIGEIMTF